MDDLSKSTDAETDAIADSGSVSQTQSDSGTHTDATIRAEHGALAISDRRSTVVVFFALTLLAWVIWGAQIAQQAGLITWAPSLSSPLNALTVWAPGLAAMVLTWRARGRRGLGALFRPLGWWRVGLRWYAVALLLMPAVWVIALAIDRAMGQRYELGPALLTSTFTAATAFMVPIAVLFTLLFTLPYAIGEELGWRGFALPRLQARHEPLVASVILGLFWGFWHTPAWIAWDSTELALLPLTIMVLSTVVTAILFTWIFNRTGGSLLLVVLFHTSIASKGYFLPSLPTLTEEVLLALIALAVVFGGGLTIHKRVE